MIRRSARLVAALAVGGLIIAACGDDDDDASNDTSAITDAPAATDAPEATDASDATAATETSSPTESVATPDTDAPETTAGGGDGAGWTVDTEDCVDPDRANAPIEGTVNIGSSMPLSGGAAAAAFAPVAQGLQAYIDYANENDLLPGHEIALTIGDDQYSDSLTPGVVNSELDNGAHLFSGMIGTQNNLAVRGLLNDECVPQILALTGAPEWGDVAEYPWTSGALIPYDKEGAAYAQNMAAEFPGGGTIGLFYVNSEFGQVYMDGFEPLATESGFEIVDTQTIELSDDGLPTAQVSSLAGNAPDVIMAVPLGAQCPRFLSELAKAKAENPGWDPRVYITNTCSSSLILAVAGAAADGIYTSASGGISDVGNPETVAASEALTSYIDYMASKGFSDGAVTAAQGWTVGEVTVEILRQAAESPEGLTQASIINASRNLDFVPSLVREGVEYRMAGEEDAYYAEDIQVIQYDAAAAIFNDIGTLNTSFRSS
ncbi:MAG: ABC transporter substrate-binding protein [Ilumatobacteraceae bacterium]